PYVAPSIAGLSGIGTAGPPAVGADVALPVVAGVAPASPVAPAAAVVEGAPASFAAAVAAGFAAGFAAGVAAGFAAGCCPSALSEARLTETPTAKKKARPIA